MMLSRIVKSSTFSLLFLIAGCGPTIVGTTGTVATPIQLEDAKLVAADAILVNPGTATFRNVRSNEVLFGDGTRQLRVCGSVTGRGPRGNPLLFNPFTVYFLDGEPSYSPLPLPCE